MIKIPFKSQSQRKFMFAAAERGDIPKKTVEEFASASKGKDLPEKVGEKEHTAGNPLNPQDVFDEMAGMKKMYAEMMEEEDMEDE